uniref:B1 variant n=1 Tax=Taenia solium TaxID=6204 RepID=Q0GGV7_TAESO|nr:B1 variant [Taenia solium]
MRASIFLAVAILVITVVAAPDDDKGQEDLNMIVMKQLGEVRRFFTEDHLGRNVTKQLKEMIAIAKVIRQRIRKSLGEYLKGLENE